MAVIAGLSGRPGTESLSSVNLVAAAQRRLGAASWRVSSRRIWKNGSIRNCLTHRRVLVLEELIKPLATQASAGALSGLNTGPQSVL